MFLTDEELVALTKRTRYTAQSRVLSALGIDHKRRPDGSLVVLGSHVEKLLDPTANERKPLKQLEPDWSMV